MTTNEPMTPQEAPTEKESRRLHIAIPNYRGWIEAPHYQSMVTLAHAIGVVNRSFYWVCPTHTIVATARQIAVNKVLEDPDAEMLMFIDDDMTFGPGDYFALEKQLEENEDIDCIGGLCFGNSIPTKPCVFGLVEGHEEYNRENIWWHVLTDYPRDQTFQTYLTGMAFMLISRKMLDAMRRDENGEIIQNYLHFHYDHPMVFNEDLAFCMKARDAGFKIWVDSRVKIGHISKDRPLIDEHIYDAHGRAIEYNKGLPHYEPVSPEETWKIRPVEPDNVRDIVGDKAFAGFQKR